MIDEVDVLFISRHTNQSCLPLRLLACCLAALLSMNKKILLAVCLVAALHTCAAQAPSVSKVEPPNWWTGMTLNTIQLMVYGEHLDNIRVTSSSPDLKVVRTTAAANPSYAFIDLEISAAARPGSCELSIQSPAGTTTIQYRLLERSASASVHQGFDCSDVIYLITPDRFDNGDTTNDAVAGMADTVNRAEPYARHGGDLQGVIDRLGYLSDLGATALWLNPVVENNMQGASYHGYGATDLYRIDPRFGTNALYASMVARAHSLGLKVIMDHVNNHIGINHPWINNLPTADWLNGTVAHHQKPFHSKPELDDIHSDSLTKQQAVNCWFEDRQADLNQMNPFVARYLTQSTIWWIEFSGIDGIREDTYPYIAPAFREEWCRTILKEYPRFNIVGEVWVQDPVFMAPYQRGSHYKRTIEPGLPSLTDFGLFDAFMKTFADSTGTIENIFTCLAKDFLFTDPNDLVTFLDNHDLRRIMYMVNGDVKRFKLALLTLLTTRGIPQILYGTEIGMKGGPDHGRLRADFPGGFPHDLRDAFTEQGRTAQENNIFAFTRHLLHLRRSHAALQSGTLIHYKPAGEVYVYVRKKDDDRCMIVINHNTGDKTISLAPYLHQLEGARRLRELISGQEITLDENAAISVGGMSGGIYEILQAGK
jgi:neopullulanase